MVVHAVYEAGLGFEQKSENTVRIDVRREGYVLFFGRILA